MIDVVKHIPLVRKIAGKFYKKFHFRYEYEELFQVGCVGLMKAIDKFDESKGFKFVTYAYPQVWGAIHNYIRDDSWYMAPNCRTRIKKAHPPDSLDIPVGEDMKNTWKEILPCDEPGYKDVELRMLVDNLSPKQKEIVIMFYFRDMTPKEITKILGITPQALYERRRWAIKNLRKELEA